MEDESTSAPESAWFFAWLKSGMRYLSAVAAYLVAVLGVVLAWKKLFGDESNLEACFVAITIALSLTLAYYLNLRPTLQRWRERAFRPIFDSTREVRGPYFFTGPRTKDPYNFFAEGYERFIDWIRDSKAPLLYLTGPSGSGKSSLIGAYLKPNLESPPAEGKYAVVVVRRHVDPLAELKDGLLVLWKTKPSDYDGLSPCEALQRAVRQLRADEKLLVVFDQFEEFLLLRTALPSVHDSVAISPHDAEVNVESLREFFDAFTAAPPNRVAILLAYREDHHCLLAPLKLPSRQEHFNWMTVAPLKFAEAELFLKSCPGLVVPQKRMERVLQEAAHQEGGRVLMRPIVANLLGLVLQNMAQNPTLSKHKDDLLHVYIREQLGDQTQEERADVLRALLSHSHTAQPRSVADISAERQLPETYVEQHLELLGYAGLVRCVNTNEGREKRAWQISHDFLATLIERVLEGVHRTVWQKVRPWTALAGLALSISLAIWLSPPWRASRELRSLGFIVKGATATVTDRQIEQPSFDRACELLGSVNSINELDLTECFRLTSLDGLDRLHGLRSLDASGCTQLRFIAALENMDELESVNFANCYMLPNVDALRGRPALVSVNLGNCDCLLSVAGLRDLPRLELLTLDDCDSLQTLKGLGHLPRLRMLSLWDCSALKSLNGIENLSGIEMLLIFRCSSIGDLDGLRAMPGLESLHIQSCPSLLTLDDLQSLGKLKELRVTDCDGLKSIDAIGKLTSLESLLLSNCAAVANTEAIGQLAGLQSLDLIQCHSLTDVSGLRSLRCLQELSIHGCESVDALDALSELTQLEKLTIRECSVSETQATELREKLPGAEIVFEP
jgi:DNA-binding transcriptional ArsR family regulator/Leucine-rich repeat (LRR) protein